MHKIEEFVDERQKSWCIHCARPLAGLETNEDHVPSKGLLAKPRPHHLPIVIICKECNTSFSLDEQVRGDVSELRPGGFYRPGEAVERERCTCPCR